ncbi:MAG: hypothetical protein H7Z14_20120 [Anaerolineae bacterium]|nr:hypothetical protein [Phycisphaerae bacterium]
MMFKSARIPTFAILTVAAIALLVLPVRAGHPKPSVYPVSWELKFDHSKAKRIVVEVPGSSTPQAFWYMTYTVSNPTDQEQNFLPEFEMLGRDGKVIRSDNNISPKVLDAIKIRERNKALQGAVEIGGPLRAGEDQAKEGVAIWREPDTRMGTFTIFVSGLSGEIAPLKDDNGQPVKDKDDQPIILRKTLEATYQVPGDEVYPGEDAVNEKSEGWVMR